LDLPELRSDLDRDLSREAPHATVLGPGLDEVVELSLDRVPQRLLTDAGRNPLGHRLQQRPRDLFGAGLGRLPDRRSHERLPEGRQRTLQEPAGGFQTGKEEAAGGILPVDRISAGVQIPVPCGRSRGIAGDRVGGEEPSERGVVVAGAQVVQAGGRVEVLAVVEVVVGRGTGPGQQAAERIVVVGVRDGARFIGQAAGRALAVEEVIGALAAGAVADELIGRVHVVHGLAVRGFPEHLGQVARAERIHQVGGGPGGAVTAHAVVQRAAPSRPGQRSDPDPRSPRAAGSPP
jgi:hypothetical protein